MPSNQCFYAQAACLQRLCCCIERRMPMKRLPWLLLPFLVLISACAAAPVATPTPDTAPAVQPAVAERAIANPRALGDPNAPLKIVYYGDYQ
jgi:hypothetical protein